jgi:hypothetical protein
LAGFNRRYGAIDKRRIDRRQSSEMQLNDARLCLDCQEVHDLDHCPSCGSESFAFLTRWVKVEAAVPTRRPLPAPVERTERLEAYRKLLGTEDEPKPPRAGRVLARGAMGLAILGAARLLWRAAAPGAFRRKPSTTDESSRTDADDGGGGAQT